jgi:hypothetical protein
MSGVAAAHQAGILHRDLKPENLFVCTDVDGTAFDTKVLDFGVAKSVGDAEASLTSTGAIVGTPRYMSPEQIAQGDEVDERMDVYALGLILYELLAGKLPYAGGSLKTMVVEILAGKLAPLHGQVPELPAALCDAVMKALANERDDRWPDVASFAAALEPFAGRKAFEPPRGVHTPETALAELTSPELERASVARRERASQRAPAAGPTSTKPRRRAPSNARLDAEAPTQREPLAARLDARAAGKAFQRAPTQPGLGRPVVATRAAGEPPKAPPPRARPALLMVALGLLMAIALGVGWATRRTSAPSYGIADAAAAAAAPIAHGDPSASAPALSPTVLPAAPAVVAAAATPSVAALAGAGAVAAPSEPALPSASPLHAAPAAPAPVASSAASDSPPREARTRRERRAASSATQERAVTQEPAVTTRGGVLRKGDF